MPVRVGRVEPERLLQQLAHRRHELVAGMKVSQWASQPSSARKRTNSLAARIAAGLEEHHGAVQITLDHQRLPLAPRGQSMVTAFR